MLQAGRSRIRYPMVIGFTNWSNLSGLAASLGSTQPLTKLSARSVLGGKARQARKVHNLTAIYEPIV
jgi:hypothetical protein